MKKGILYSLANICWGYNLLKCGRTNNLKTRLSQFHTGLPENCVVVCTTKELLDANFYENYMKKILKECRYNREFFDVSYETIISLYDLFDVINSMYDDEDSLREYEKSIFQEKKKYCKRVKKSKKKAIFIYTNNYEKKYIQNKEKILKKT